MPFDPRYRATMMIAAASAALLAAGWAGAQGFPRHEAPKGAKVYFITPTDGETVKSPFPVRFGLEGMGVAPAGVAYDNTGHHHLIIDSATPNLDLPVPKDDKHIHFGGGQTETRVELPPGKHTLQLVLGDVNHMPHTNPVVSEVITITVE